MTPPNKSPVFTSVLTVLALVVLGEGWCIYERRGAALAGEAKLVQKRAELQAMADAVPPPTREVAALIDADLARSSRALATMQAELQGRGPAAERLRATRAPVARTDAFFDLATFVERERELAKKQGVELKGEASRFGFAAYANEGPDERLIAPVHRQRLVAQHLIESLFEARPRALLSLQRERPLTVEERKQQGEAAAAGTPPPEAPVLVAGDSPDYFAIDPRVSARVPGSVEAVAFRLTFVGQTTALRAFLNKLAAFELPLVVRSVEVESAAGDEGGESAAAEAVAPAVGARTAAAPLIAKSTSKFTVTVEFISLLTPAADDAGAGAKPTT